MTRGDGFTPRLGLGHDSGWSGLSRGQPGGGMPAGGSSMYGAMREGPPISFGEIADATVDEMFGRGAFRRSFARSAGRTAGRIAARRTMAPGRARARARWGTPGAGNVGTSHPMREAEGSLAWQQGLVPGQDWGAPAPYDDPYAAMQPYEEGGSPGSDMLDAEIDALLAEDDDGYEEGGYEEGGEYGAWYGEDDLDDEFGDDDDSEEVFGVIVPKDVYPQLLEGREAKLHAKIDKVNTGRLQRLYADPDASFWFKALVMDELEKRGVTPNEHGDEQAIAAAEAMGLFDDVADEFGRRERRRRHPVRRAMKRAVGRALRRRDRRRRRRRAHRAAVQQPPAPVSTAPGRVYRPVEPLSDEEPPPTPLPAGTPLGLIQAGYYSGDTYGYSPDDDYGVDPEPPRTQVIVHRPPAEGTFNEALKTGLGLGVGFMAVALGAAALSGMLSRG